MSITEPVFLTAEHSVYVFSTACVKQECSMLRKTGWTVFLVMTVKTGLNMETLV